MTVPCYKAKENNINRMLSGLYDMHGNVAEWTVSKYAQDQDERCVVRGGSYIERPKHATSYTRKPYYPWQRVFNVGFRLVINE